MKISFKPTRYKVAMTLRYIGFLLLGVAIGLCF